MGNWEILDKPAKKWTFSNIKNCEWVYILPQLSFHLAGYRNNKRRDIIPAKYEGIQINFRWLWFDIFYSNVEWDAPFGDENNCF